MANEGGRVHADATIGVQRNSRQAGKRIGSIDPPGSSRGRTVGAAARVRNRDRGKARL